MTIFSWSIISAIFVFLTSKHLKGPRILALGLLDLSLAVILGIGVGLQGNYLPSTSRGCKKATMWQTTDEKDNFFTVLSNRDGAISTAQSQCSWLVSAWAQAVACL